MTVRALLRRPSARSAALAVLAQRWPLGVLAVVAAGFAAPIGLLSHGTARARACVAAYESPRGSTIPDCRNEIRWFVTPSRIPWTATAARYRAEELNMRAAIAAYHDAAVGRPDAEALLHAGQALVDADNVILAGSQRLALEELGRAVGAPDLGRSAMLLGDRLTLLARADHWEHWAPRVRTLEAALLSGNMDRAAEVARRYAEWDPRDEDLRTAVAAMLCLRGDASRGLTMLGTVQTDRAANRHESWARNWGEVRAALVACADRASLTVPPPPERADAGQGDRLEARAALRLRLFAKHRIGDSEARRTAAWEVIQMLKGSALAPGVRVRLLAALLGSGHGVDPNLAAQLATPRIDDDELPLTPAPYTFTALDWLSAPRSLVPSPSLVALVEGVETLRTMAASPEVSAEERLVLEAARAAMIVEAAREHARAGDGSAAVAVLDRAGTLSGAARALARASAWYVAGDRARALAEMDRDPPDLGDVASVRVVWLIQKAELLASAGRREEAARAAIAADEAAASLGVRSLEVRALWTRVALAREAPLRAPAPPPLPGARRWPWVGEIGTSSSWLAPEAESPAALARALDFWDRARKASPEDRRAIRYAAASQHRGDAPSARTAYLALAGELLLPGEGDVEVWLDAFAASSHRRIGLRAYAWMRAEAARFRGDTASAERWSRTYRALVELVAGEPELAAALGI